jgi:hypothetical protein
MFSSFYLEASSSSSSSTRNEDEFGSLVLDSRWFFFGNKNVHSKIH